MSDESPITPYKAFVNCIKMGDELNSDDGDELLEIVEGEFDRKLANGLRWRVFSLDTETSPDHEDENEEAKPCLLENEERVSPEPNALQKIWAQCLPLSSVKRNKKIPSPLMVGTEKIAKDTLHKYISWLNVCIAVFKIDMPIHVEWDHDRNAYRASGSGEAKDTVFSDVIFVTPDEYASAIADEEASVCSYGDALPDQKMMSTAAVKNCFFYTDKLYLWSSGEWQVFEWKDAPETAAPSVDESEQKDEAEDAQEPGETHGQPAAE